MFQEVVDPAALEDQADLEDQAALEDQADIVDQADLTALREVDLVRVAAAREADLIKATAAREKEEDERKQKEKAKKACCLHTTHVTEKIKLQCRKFLSPITVRKMNNTYSMWW